MMIYEVTTTEQAESDLRGIYEYIAFELLSPDNAAGQLDRLEENIIGLEQFPEKYKAYDKEPYPLFCQFPNSHSSPLPRQE